MKFRFSEEDSQKIVELLGEEFFLQDEKEEKAYRRGTALAVAAVLSALALTFWILTEQGVVRWSN